MGNKFRFNAADMADALRDTRGIKAVAARRLGCTVDTIDNYIKKFPTVAQGYRDGRASIVDMAEGQLVKKLNAGEWPAVHYTLTTLGKDRGYAPAQDVNLNQSGTLKIQVVYGDDADHADSPSA